MVPTLELPPVIPFTFQVTAEFVEFCTGAVNCWERPTRTVALAGETVTFTGAAGVTVTTAEPMAEGAKLLCACTVTLPEGTAAGAVYNPAVVTEPTEELPPATPFTLQLTL